MKSIKNKINEFANQLQEDINQQKSDPTRKNRNYQQSSYATSNPEQVIGTMWSYFFAFWIGLFISVFAVISFIGNPKTFYLAILIIIAIPIWAIFCFFMMIPDIKILGVTIFSRRSLSLRKSVSLGRRIVYTFSKEFYRQNPWLATFLFVYLLAIIFAILYAVY